VDVDANRERAASRVALVVTGLATGLVSGLLGIGGGLVAVFGLAGVLRWRQHHAHATALAAIPPLAAVGAVVFWRSGEIDGQVGLSLIAGSLLGAALGARIMARLPERVLRISFGLLMLALGVRLMLP
jgi:uncharacterized membrane protein YfcA